jgi:transcription initiation factor TFIID TATA-box-binding protein
MVAVRSCNASIDAVEAYTSEEIGSKEKGPLVKIQNVITTADLKQHVNIIRFNQFRWGRYDLEDNYNGKVGYVKDNGMRGRVTVFSSGKMISTGAKSELQSIRQLYHTMKLLIDGNFIKRKQLEPKVHNIVAVMDMQSKLDLNHLSQELTKMIYEPEQFPGAIYRTEQGPTCLIFASGKIVIAGARSVTQLISVANTLREKTIQFCIVAT